MPIPGDSIAICSFGDASANHATAQTALNAAAWTAYQKLPAPVLCVCEDNGTGISVPTPEGWIASTFSAQEHLAYFACEGEIDEIWDVAYSGDPSTVTVHVRRLREKIEADPSEPRHLVTVWGSGYRFEP